MGAKRNHLTHEQFYALCEAMRADQAAIEAFTSWSVAADYVSGKLGFSVSQSSLEAAMRTLKMTLTPRKKRRVKGWTWRECLAARSEITAGVLAALCKRLRLTVPPVLLKFAIKEWETEFVLDVETDLFPPEEPAAHDDK